MTDISLTILPETADDAAAIERLHERTFGPGRYAKTAYRIREGVAHWPRSVVHRADRHAAGRLGAALADPHRRNQGAAARPAHRRAAVPRAGIGQALIERALEEAKAKGHRLVVLVGDEPYYGKCGFKRIPRGRATMPGPVDPARLLVAELADGAFEGVSGPITPEWGGA